MLTEQIKPDPNKILITEGEAKQNFQSCMTMYV